MAEHDRQRSRQSDECNQKCLQPIEHARSIRLQAVPPVTGVAAADSGVVALFAMWGALCTLSGMLLHHVPGITLVTAPWPGFVAIPAMRRAGVAL